MNTWHNNSYDQQNNFLLFLCRSHLKSSSEACYSDCSNQPRTHQWGHPHRPPLRPLAICGLVWAADSLVPLALQRGTPPVLFNYLHECHLPNPSAEPLCSLCQGHPGHMTSDTLTCLIDNVITVLPFILLFVIFIFYVTLDYNNFPASISKVILNLPIRMRKLFSPNLSNISSNSKSNETQ